jgi:hypothetical protein
MWLSANTAVCLPTRRHQSRHVAPGTVPAVLALVLALGLAAGCTPKAQLPKLVPVRGKVVFRDGGPLTGGTIQFQSQQRLDVVASSVIGADGSFELSSFISGARAPGAVPGLHRVIIEPPFAKGSQSAPTIPPQEITVTEGENSLTITIEKPVPSR